MFQAQMEYEHVRCTRRCEVTGREFAPGETFYSVLSAAGGGYVRHDYSEQAWQGPPEGAFGWWKSHMPKRDGQKVQWAPNDVLLNLLEQTADDPQRRDLRYILALLLVRRRVCRLEETERDETGSETLVLYCPRREVEYRVAVAMPDEARTQQIQEELAQWLFAQ